MCEAYVSGMKSQYGANLVPVLFSEADCGGVRFPFEGETTANQIYATTTWFPDFETVGSFWVPEGTNIVLPDGTKLGPQVVTNVAGSLRWKPMESTSMWEGFQIKRTVTIEELNFLNCVNQSEPNTSCYTTVDVFCSTNPLAAKYPTDCSQFVSRITQRPVKADPYNDLSWLPFVVSGVFLLMIVVAFFMSRHRASAGHQPGRRNQRTGPEERQTRGSTYEPFE